MTSYAVRYSLWMGTALVIAGCSGPADFDVRGGFGDAPSTAEAARNATATANRPVPDARGVISYPSYQVAVAQRGDTVNSLAARVGTDVSQLARFNGLQPGDTLRDGEIVALPGRVSEPAGGPITPGAVDITSLAGSAIDAADASGSGNVTTSTLEPAPTGQPRGVTGVEPVRHRVARGETAFSISRLYQVSVSSLASWNGLGSDFAVREGQQLLIPVALAAPSDEPEKELIALPGVGAQTPEPPSASKPLPDEETTPVSEPVETVAAPDLSEPEQASAARMIMPVEGAIVREYAAGRNDGISISATPGTPVRAAASGVVAAITEDTNGVPIIVVKHQDNLLTVYSNIDKVAVRKGQTVSRGAKLAEIRSGGSRAMNFEVREGFDSVDPGPYLN